MKLYRYLNFKASELDEFNPYRRSKVELFNDQNEGDSLLWNKGFDILVETIENLVNSKLDIRVRDIIEREYDFEMNKGKGQPKVTDLPVSIMCLTPHEPYSRNHDMWSQYGRDKESGIYGECLEFDVAADHIFIEFCNLGKVEIANLQQDINAVVSFLDVEYGELPFVNNYAQLLSFERLSTLNPSLHSMILVILRHISFAKKRDKQWEHERELRFMWTPLVYGVIGDMNNNIIRTFNLTENMSLYPICKDIKYIGSHLYNDTLSL